MACSRVVLPAPQSPQMSRGTWVSWFQSWSSRASCAESDSIPRQSSLASFSGRSGRGWNDVLVCMGVLEQDPHSMRWRAATKGRRRTQTVRKIPLQLSDEPVAPGAVCRHAT